jgi:YtcA family
MQHTWEGVRALPVALAIALMGGCALRGAPSFILFGAFFPAWMFVAGIGILAAIGARVVLAATRLVDVLPLQLVVCVSVGVTVAVLTWLIWFER